MMPLTSPTSSKVEADIRMQILTVWGQWEIYWRLEEKKAKINISLYHSFMKTF